METNILWKSILNRYFGTCRANSLYLNIHNFLLLCCVLYVGGVVFCFCFCFCFVLFLIIAVRQVTNTARKCSPVEGAASPCTHTGLAEFVICHIWRFVMQSSDPSDVNRYKDFWGQTLALPLRTACLLQVILPLCFLSPHVQRIDRNSLL